MTRTALGLSALLVAGALRAHAQEPPPPPATFREEILVSAPKVPLPLDETPSSATVLTAGEIALTGARTLPELLEAAGGGFHVYDFGGAGTFSAVDLRGFYSAGETSYAIVQVDGMAVNDLDTDNVDWNLVDLARIERVEVLRGPVSSLYGNIGMSGLINVVTRRPGPGLGGALAVGGGDPGRAEASGTAAWGGERTSLDLGVRRQEVDGWRRHSAWDGTLAQSRLQWAPESRRLDLAANALYLASNRDKPGAIPTGTPIEEAGTPLDREGSRAWETGLALALPLGGDAHLEARAAARGKREEAVDTIFFLPLEHAFETTSGSGELRYRRAFSLRGRGGRLLAGAEGTAGRIDGSYFAVDDRGARAARIDRARARRDALGAFAAVEIDLTRGLAFAAGMRWDGIRGNVLSEAGNVPAGRSDLSAASPSLTLNRRLGAAGNAFLSVSRSFKAPTLEQLFDRRPFFVAPDAPPLYLSNDALLPQRAWNLELGLRTRLGNRAWTDLALYSLKVRDEIGFDLAHLRFDNIDRSVHRGIEWNLTAYPTDHLRPRLSYVLSHTTFDGGLNRGHQINGVPRQQATAAIAWLQENGTAGGPGAGLWAEVSLHHARGQFIDEANRFPISPYTLFDAAAGYRFRRFPGIGVELTARNLTDERFTPDGFVSLDQRGQPLPLYYPGSRRSVAGLLRIEK